MHRPSTDKANPAVGTRYFLLNDAKVLDKGEFVQLWSTMFGQ